MCTHWVFLGIFTRSCQRSIISNITGHHTEFWHFRSRQHLLTKDVYDVTWNTPSMKCKPTNFRGNNSKVVSNFVRPMKSMLNDTSQLTRKIYINPSNSNGLFSMSCVYWMGSIVYLCACFFLSSVSLEIACNWMKIIIICSAIVVVIGVAVGFHRIWLFAFDTHLESLSILISICANKNYHLHFEKQFIFICVRA